MKFTDSLDKLSKDFKSKGIPTSEPGFYDHPNFMEVEKTDPSFLETYAAFVVAQPYSDEYLTHARKVITNAATILHEKLKENGRLGACVDASGILSRILEKEGIWNCGIKGSLTITFPPESKEEETYFWSIDKGEFVAAHAWLFAPPFSIVDVSVKLQPYSGKKTDYLPNIVLSDNASQDIATVEDILSPELVHDLSFHGVPKVDYFKAVGLNLEKFNKVFPVFLEQGTSNTNIKYCPVAIHAPDCPLEEMENMEFDGKTPIQTYNQCFVGKL